VTATELRHGYLAALAGGRPRDAAALVDDALGAGVDAHSIYLDVLQPALIEVGSRWERGELSVAQEHLATAVTESITARIASRLAPTQRPRAMRAVVSCTPGELHSVGARFVSDFLEADGWEVLALGASTPIDALVELVAHEQPHVVALSTTMPHNLDRAAEVFARLRDLPSTPLLLAGGGAYRGDGERALRVGADLYASDAGQIRVRLAEHFGARR
jgi:methanogenic corrinoid protein MtbC1